MARETNGNNAPITLRTYYIQKVLGFNRGAYWPAHPSSQVIAVSKIRIGIDTAPGLSPGCYIQGINGIEIGDYSTVAPNVGIISANHSIYNYSKNEKERPIRIGRYCWIGMNAVILPGVCLGDHTIVAAGAVVKDSFPIGYCVLGGVPARVIKKLDGQKVEEMRKENEYIGYHQLGKESKSQLFERLGIKSLE